MNAAVIAETSRIFTPRSSATRPSSACLRMTSDMPALSLMPGFEDAVGEAAVLVAEAPARNGWALSLCLRMLGRSGKPPETPAGTWGSREGPRLNLLRERAGLL